MKGSGLANGSSRVEPCALVAGGCLAMPAAIKAGTGAGALLPVSWGWNGHTLVSDGSNSF